MSLPSLKKVPQTRAAWERFHWSHYIDHKIILGVIRAKTGETLFMPPIWPVPGNDYTARLSFWHQTLHQQMHALSGDNSYDFLQTDLTTQEGQESFIYTNYGNHLAFHTLIGF